MLTERKFLPVVIVFLIAAIAVLLLFYAFNIGENSDSQSNSNRTLTTYSNEKENFRLSHPAHWEVHEATDEGEVVLTNYDYSRQNSENLSKNHVKVVIRKEPNPDKLSPQQWINQKVATSMEVTETESLQTKDAAALKVRIQSQKDSEYYLIYFKHGSNMYEVTSLNQSDDRLHQLVSSFKFTGDAAAQSKQHDSDNQHSQKSPNNTSPPANQRNNQTDSDTTTTYRTLTPNEFRELYYDTELPNTRQPKEAPHITGDAATDEYIRVLATNRGYKLQRVPTSELSNIEGYAIQSSAGQSWVDMKKAAQKERGIEIAVVSGYRSIEEQRKIFMSRLASEGTATIDREYTNQEILSGQADEVIDNILATSSIPGYSKHHTGYAIDITDVGSGLDFEQFSKTDGYKWLSDNNFKNAKRFGFIPSYPKGAEAQGPEPEAWEYVWVGQENLIKEE